MDFLTDPIFKRGTERWIIAIGAIFICYFGYKLAKLRLPKEKIAFLAKHRKTEFFFSGNRPGTFFMLLGAIILGVLIIQGGALRQKDRANERVRGMLAPIVLDQPKAKKRPKKKTSVPWPGIKDRTGLIHKESSKSKESTKEKLIGQEEKKTDKDTAIKFRGGMKTLELKTPESE